MSSIHVRFFLWPQYHVPIHRKESAEPVLIELTTPTTNLNQQIWGRKKILGKQQQKYILWKYYINVNIYIYIHTVIHIIVDANKSLYSQPSEIWNNRFTPTTCRPQQPLPAWRVGLVVIHVDDFAVVVNAEGHLCRRMLRFCVFPEGPAKRLQWSQELP